MSVLYKGRGYVVRWKLQYGYGFVKLTHVMDEESGNYHDTDELIDIFVHNKQITNMSGYRSLIEGQIVEFDVVINGHYDDGKPKHAARDLSVISTPTSAVGEVNGNC